MTNEEKMRILHIWESGISDSEDAFDPLIELLGLQPEGPLCEMVWNAQSALTSMAAASLGDEEGWLAWYWLENDMGKKEMKAGYDGNLKKVKSLQDLMELISYERP